MYTGSTIRTIFIISLVIFSVIYIGGSLAASTPDSNNSDWSSHQYDMASSGHSPNSSGPSARPTTLWEFEILPYTQQTNDNEILPYKKEASFSRSGSGSERLNPQSGTLLNYSNLSISQSEISVGSTITIYADIENTGSLTERFNASLKINGSIRSHQTGTLASGETTTVTFTQSLSKVGNHSISVNNLTSQYVMVENAWHRLGYDFRGSRYNPYTTGPKDNLTKRWGFNINSDGWANKLTVVNNTVYVGTTRYIDYKFKSADYAGGTLYAINAETGAEIWNFTIDIDERGDIFSAPTVVNGIVYFGSLDNNIYAVNSSTGEKIWSFETGGSVYSSPAVVNETVYFGSYDNKVYAINATSGQKIWSFESDCKYDNGNDPRIRASPAVARGNVYIGCVSPLDRDDYFYSINASTGEEVWRFEMGDVYGMAAVVDGAVYVGSGREYGSAPRSLYAINASTGQQIWNYSVDTRIFSLSVANGVVYFGDRGGDIHAINTTRGDKVWSVSGSGYADRNPAITDDAIYAISNEKLFVLDPKSGDEISRYNFDDAIQSPVVLNGSVYITSGENVYALTQSTQLNLTTNRTTITSGQTVRFNVTRSDTGESVNATIHVDNTSKITGSNGKANYTFTKSGEFVARVSKRNTPVATFVNDTVTVSVNRRPVNLNLTANTSKITVDDTVEFILTRGDTGSPVNGTINVDGSKLETGDDGTASHTFSNVGTYTATASKSNTSRLTFVNDSLSISVNRRTAQLNLTANQTLVTAGGTVQFAVRRVDTGDLTNATITIDNETRYASDGSIVVSFPIAGSFRATVRKENTSKVTFEQDQVSTTVERRSVSLQVQANATDITAGESVQFTVSRTDTGNVTNATMSVGGNMIVTGPDGKTVYQFDKAGEFTAITGKQNTSSATFQNDSTTVSVNRKQVQLIITTNTSSVTAGESVQFTVSRTDTKDATNATLAIEENTIGSGPDGTVIYTFTESGYYSPTVTKANTSTETFESDSLNITVDKKSVDLVLTANRSVSQIGDRIEFILIRNDTGEPIDGSIQVNDTTLRTGSNGRGIYIFEDSGKFTAKASKSDTTSSTFINDTFLISIESANTSIKTSANGTEQPETESPGLPGFGPGIAFFSICIFLSLILYRE